MLRLDIDGPAWTVELEMASGGTGWIVWQTGSTRRTFDVPAGVLVKRELDGSTTTWPGGPYSLTQRPVLFLLPIE
jgi:fructose-1,6-bisphosphatase/inositol monophosphatase family enzyme